MSKHRFIWLLISMFMVYTQGLWERIFSLPSGTSLLVELPLWMYLLLSIKKVYKHTPVSNLIVLYIVFTFIASIINQTGYVDWAKYIRFFVYFYMIYASLWNSNIHYKQWLMILKFSVFTILIQGVGAAIDFFIFNQRIEGHVGLMSSIGGTTAATFPLMIVSSIAVVYIFARNLGRKSNLYLLFITISALFVGYGSGKRAIFFTIPFLLLIIVTLTFYYLRGNSNFYKKLISFSILIILVLPVYIYGITTSKGFNYGLSGRESNIEIIEEALFYAQNYESSIGSHGQTIGRTNTSLQVIDNSIASIPAFLFGNGFGSVKDEGTRSTLNIGYGIVGFIRDIISGGWIVMLLTLIIICKVILTNKSVDYLFTSMLRVVVIGIFVFTHFAYSSDFVVSLKINFLMIIFLIFINSPTNYIYLNLIINRYFYPALK